MAMQKLRCLAYLLLTLLLVFTSWLWVPVLILTSPVWLPVCLLLYYFLATFRRVARFLRDCGVKFLLSTLYFLSNVVLSLRKLLTDPSQLTLGYAVDSPTGFSLRLDPADDSYRFTFQLYHFIATGFRQLPHFRGLHIIEINCKQPFPLEFLVRSLNPASALGLTPTSRTAKRFNSLFSSIPNLRFHANPRKNAFPVKNECADAVINIENHVSSTQFQEIYRILKPGGHLFYANLQFSATQIDEIFVKNGFKIVSQVDISHNVIRSIELSKHFYHSKGCFSRLKRVFRRVFNSYEVKIAGKLERGELVYTAVHAIKPI